MLRAQTDKMTNSMNQMSNTSSGMLIEFLINLLDDSGGGGGDMWKGRAIGLYRCTYTSFGRIYVTMASFSFHQKYSRNTWNLKTLEESVFVITMNTD